MILKKFYLKCLSHGSYFLADEESREAAIIDPQRDVDQYLAILKEEGYKLKYILETHVHADFISGHWDLAAETGAKVVFGAMAMAKRPFFKVREGDELKLGKNISIKVLETPGHTPESVCYLVKDFQHPESALTLFSGDTLFVGDVGRPDLLGTKMPARDLALMLYNTLEKKIKTLPDATRVYPAHGAGSACGKKIGDAEYTTIGAEKISNYAMQAKDKETFVHLVTSDLPTAPGYFSEGVRLNLEGTRSLKDALQNLPGLSAKEFVVEISKGAMILDTRRASEFSSGHIQNAINIGLEGQFAPWLGTLFSPSTAIVLVCEAGTEAEAAIRCGRIGYENIRGYLLEGIETWKYEGQALESFSQRSPEEITQLRAEIIQIVDVRNPSETIRGIIPGAILIPLNQLKESLRKLDQARPLWIYCAGGYRSSIAASLLRNLGWKNVSELAGGMEAYLKAGLPIEKEAPVDTAKT